MHHHLEKGDSGDSDILEVVGVGLPRFSVTDGFLFGGVVGVEGIFLGIDELDVVVELCLERLVLEKEDFGADISLPHVFNAASMFADER